MEKVYIGKIVNTHGIKGEIRIISDFPFKEKVFSVGNSLIIDDVSYKINSYRVHKDYDMVTLGEFNNINDVLFLLKKKVYFDKDLLNLDDNQVLDSELVTYKVLSDKGKTGKIVEIFVASKTNKILRIMFDKEVLIPLNSPFIKKIDKKNKEITVEVIEGM